MKIGNKTYETVTLELLEKLEACQRGVDFFRRNNLEGFPLNRLHEVEGANGSDISWLIYTLKAAEKWEYDKNGNVTKKVFPNGSVYKYEYDQDGNMTKKVLPNGSAWSSEYDLNGNKVKEEDSDGNVTEFEYDQDGNVTKRVDWDGDVWKYEYDQNGNKTKTVDYNGRVKRFESSFYPDGQLKSYRDLEIPFFEKPSESD